MTTVKRKQHYYATARLKSDFMGLAAGSFVGVRFLRTCQPGCDLYAIYRGAAQDSIAYLGLAIDGEQIHQLCL